MLEIPQFFQACICNWRAVKVEGRDLLEFPVVPSAPRIRYFRECECEGSELLETLQFLQAGIRNFRPAQVEEGELFTSLQVLQACICNRRVA